MAHAIISQLSIITRPQIHRMYLCMVVSMDTVTSHSAIQPAIGQYNVHYQQHHQHCYNPKVPPHTKKIRKVLIKT